MKTKKRIFLFAFGVLFFVGTHTVNAQVTIGGETAPVKGATLDLSPSGGYIGGLKLPNVSLNSLTAIPTSFTEEPSATASELVGTVVYNTNATVGGKGMYMWDGTQWEAVSSTGTSSSLDNIYPVGSIYISTSSTNPGSVIGGTWESWGEGRVLVGVDADDTDFETVEKTGGEKTHTLTVNEMPTHTHIQNAHLHNMGAPQNGAGGWTGGWAFNAPALNASKGINQVSASVTTATNQNTGGSQSHNNLQPYITCYMWKRTS